MRARHHLGLMRLATLMMSLRLAGALTLAPEPIVMATSFSVSVWQICYGRQEGRNPIRTFGDKYRVGGGVPLNRGLEGERESSPLRWRCSEKPNH